MIKFWEGDQVPPYPFLCLSPQFLLAFPENLQAIPVKEACWLSKDPSPSSSPNPTPVSSPGLHRPPTAASTALCPHLQWIRQTFSNIPSHLSHYPSLQVQQTLPGNLQAREARRPGRQVGNLQICILFLLQFQSPSLSPSYTATHCGLSPRLGPHSQETKQILVPRPAFPPSENQLSTHF